MKKILINYAEGRFKNSQLKNSQSGLAAGFNTVFQMSAENIDPDFRNTNKAILNSTKGAGYWLWKPYFLNHLINEINTNDLIFYADAGSVFIKNVGPIFDQIISSKTGVLCFSLAGNHLEKHYTKADLFKYMHLNNDSVRDTPQRMASFIGMRKTAIAKRICAEFLCIASHYHLISDSDNLDGFNEPEFVGHRHDQSIWSLLTKKYDLQPCPDPTQWGTTHGESLQENHFINHTRDPR